jgi:hypothetical protein
MKKYFRFLNAAATTPHQVHGFQGRFTTKGSETTTWMIQGAIWGLIIGLMIGFVILGMISVFISANKESLSSFPYLYLTPVIGGFFGMFSGALVGIGTPRFNRHPQQGRKKYLPKVDI